MAKVRQANVDDLFDLLVLAREFSREAPKQHKWDKDKSEAALANAITSDDYCMFVIEDDEGELQGGLLGTITEPFMSRRRVAIELGWFVSKDFRGNKASLELVKHFEEWGKSKEASTIIMADLSGLADLGQLYKRLGYEIVESSYAKEI